MIYKLASRDNIDHEHFEFWPAVLNSNFKRFNNVVEEPIFHTEDDILNWLESRCRTKSTARTINLQEFRNGDPNKIYSVYACEHEDHKHTRNNSIETSEFNDRYLYSLRIKKPHEAYTTFNNEKGARIKSSFKRIDSGIDYSVLLQFDVDYSSNPRLIGREFIEGIYPLEDEKNNNDKVYDRYVQFVTDIHEKDSEENKLKEYSVVYANSAPAVKWLNQFMKKLDQLEKFLEFFSRGGNNYVNIKRDPVHNDLLRYMFKLLSDNRLDTPEDDEMQSNIRAMMVDPYLSNQEIYQVRFNKTLLSWHKNYGYIIKKTGLIPSKVFSDLVMNFSLMDFFKQIHPKENIEAMIQNIKDIYGINNEHKDIETDPMTFIRKKASREQPKFFKITKSFNTQQ